MTNLVIQIENLYIYKIYIFINLYIIRREFIFIKITKYNMTKLNNSRRKNYIDIELIFIEYIFLFDSIINF